MSKPAQVEHFTALLTGGKAPNITHYNQISMQSKHSSLFQWEKKRFYNIHTRAQCHKTFFVCNLLIFLIDQSVCPWQSFVTSLIFAGEARRLPQSGAIERCFSRVSSDLNRKHQTWPERLATDKSSHLLQKFLNYSQKSFIKLCLGANDIKRLLSINYGLRNKLECLSLASLSSLV